MAERQVVTLDAVELTEHRLTVAGNRLRADSVIGIEISKVIRALGLRVAEDISLITFHDADWTDVTSFADVHHQARLPPDEKDGRTVVGPSPEDRI